MHTKPFVCTQRGGRTQFGSRAHNCRWCAQNTGGGCAPNPKTTPFPGFSPSLPHHASKRRRHIHPCCGGSKCDDEQSTQPQQTLRRPQGTKQPRQTSGKPPQETNQRKSSRFRASLGAPGTRRAGFRWGPRGAKRRRSPAYGRRRGRRPPSRTQRAELVAKRAPQFSRKSQAASGGENGAPSLPLRRCARPKKERFGVQWDMGCWLASPPDFLRRAELPESPAGQQ